MIERETKKEERERERDRKRVREGEARMSLDSHVSLPPGRVPLCSGPVVDERRRGYGQVYSADVGLRSGCDQHSYRLRETHLL